MSKDWGKSWTITPPFHTKLSFCTNKDRTRDCMNNTQIRSGRPLIKRKLIEKCTLRRPGRDTELIQISTALSFQTSRTGMNLQPQRPQPLVVEAGPTHQDKRNTSHTRHWARKNTLEIIEVCSLTISRSFRDITVTLCNFKLFDLNTFWFFCTSRKQGKMRLRSENNTETTNQTNPIDKKTRSGRE